MHPDTFDQLQEEHLWPTLADDDNYWIGQREADDYRGEICDEEQEELGAFADWEAEQGDPRFRDDEPVPDAYLDMEFESRFEIDFDLG